MASGPSKHSKQGLKVVCRKKTTGKNCLLEKGTRARSSGHGVQPGVLLIADLLTEVPGMYSTRATDWALSLCRGNIYAVAWIILSIKTQSYHQFGRLHRNSPMSPPKEVNTNNLHSTSFHMTWWYLKKERFVETITWRDSVAHESIGGGSSGEERVVHHPPGTGMWHVLSLWCEGWHSGWFYALW